MRHGTRGVPLCAACQTWLTCGHLSAEPPWVHNGPGESGPTGVGVFLSLSLPPSCCLSLLGPLRGPGRLFLAVPLSDEVRQNVAARQFGPCECVRAERTQDHRHRQNNEADCWFPPSSPSAAVTVYLTKRVCNLLIQSCLAVIVDLHMSGAKWQGVRVVNKDM